MRVQDRDFAFLWDMLDAAQAITKFTTTKSLDDFMSDEMLQAAVERKLEIIGEAARNVSKGFKRRHPQIPWHRIVGQRNFIVHEYGRVNHSFTWRIVTQSIPDLIKLVTPLLPPVPVDSQDSSEKPKSQ